MAGKVKKSVCNCIEFFCGVGGLSLGASRAGLKIVAGIDNDQRALQAHANNFPNALHLNSDVGALKVKSLLKSIHLEQDEVEAIIGGPPCQGFSRMGHRNLDDPRNSLFSHFLRLVSGIHPRFFLLENVPGILDKCFDRIRESAFIHVRDYEILGPVILKASDYGAATTRARVFYIGYQKKYYKSIYKDDFLPDNSLVSSINVKEALKGLKKTINPSWKTEKDGWRKITHKPKGFFWDKIFEEFPSGVGNSAAIEALLKNNLVSGCLGTDHGAGIIKRYANLMEGEVDKCSRAVRLRRKGLCPTLRAGTGPDRGSYQAVRPIHPTEPRVITPREAARLQGFPDWFQFDKTKWHSFRQIGNSVSPILAEAVVGTILSKRK